jgi:type I restriction enzyme S subunit
MSAECSAGNIPPGYKQTEVGVIPEDWEVKLLGDLFDFSGGLSASRDQLSMEGYCYLHYGDIHTSNRTFIDVRSEQQEIPKLDIPLKKASSTSLLEDGDVVFVDASEDDEGTSRHVVIINKDKIPFISGLHTIVAKSKTGELDHQYRRYCFQTVDIKRQFRFFAVGTKVSGISKTNIARITLPVPPVPEQEAIAEALSDADAFIESLEQLISKKRQIKQGAMQELLTGKRRLPGFSGEWETKRLGDIAEIQSGGTPSTTQPQFWDGDVLWCTPTDITALKGHKYLSDTSRKITLQGLKCSSAEMIPAKSIVMTSRATIGECAINQVPVSTNQGFKNLIPFESVDVEFLYYLLLTKKQEFISLCGGSTFLEISKTQLFTFEVKLPATKEEQTAIATILSDMDSEITALEEKLAKASQIKQGMMQELLTGRIRLL